MVIDELTIAKRIIELRKQQDETRLILEQEEDRFFIRYRVFEMRNRVARLQGAVNELSLWLDPRHRNTEAEHGK